MAVVRSLSERQQVVLDCYGSLTSSSDGSAGLLSLSTIPVMELALTTVFSESRKRRNGRGIRVPLTMVTAGPLVETHVRIDINAHTRTQI